MGRRPPSLTGRWSAREQNSLLLSAAIGFALGIWLASKTESGWWPLWLLGPVLLTGAVFRLIRLPTRWLCLPLLVVAGLLWAQPALTPPTPAEGAYQDVCATVYGDPTIRDDGRIALLLCQVQLDGNPQPGMAYCTIYPDAQIEPDTLFDGASLQFAASVYHPQPPQNVYDFDFRMWLLQKGIAYGVSGIRDLRVLNTPATAPWMDVAGRIRTFCAQKLQSAMGDRSSLAMAMLLGDRDGLAEEENTAFQRAGVAHLMAVSGLHVGLLAAALMALMNALYLRREIRLPVMAAFVALYCLLTGLSAATLRAAVMLVLVLLAQFAGRKPDPRTTLGGAALLVLVMQPLQLFSAGFVLSFSAMTGILLLYQPLLTGVTFVGNWFGRLLPPPNQPKNEPPKRAARVASAGQPLPPQLENTVGALTQARPSKQIGRAVHSQSANFQKKQTPSALQKAWQTGRKRFVQLLAVSMAAQAGVLLPTATYFHQFPTYGILFNLLAVPIAGLLVPLYALVLLTSLLPWVGGALALLPGWVAAQGSGLLLWLVRLSAYLPGAQIRVATPTLWFWLALFVTMVAMSRYIRAALFRRLLTVIAVVVIALAGAYATRPASLRYHQFAVGQGDAALLIDGNHTLAIDVGPYGGEMAGRLLAEGRDLDALLITHLHADHVQGIRYLLQQGIIIHTLYLPQGADEGATSAESLALLDMVKASGIPIVTLAAGEQLTTPGIRIEVLWPQNGRERAGLDANERSLATLIDMDGLRILSMADNSSLYDAYFATACDVLKVGHHGSREATSEALLQVAHPQLAVITCEQGKALPSQDTLKRLAKHDVKVLRTDVTGELVLERQDGKTRLWCWNAGGINEP